MLVTIPVNLAEKLSAFSEQWSPRVVAEMNDYPFKAASSTPATQAVA